MKKYSISEKEVAEVRKTLKMTDSDAFVLVVADKETAKKALENVCWRAEMGKVPNETRKANPDGSTSYMRPLPGKARLYPETDIPPIPITKEAVTAVKKASSESLDEKKDKLAKTLNKEMADRMLKSRNLPLFERLVGTFPDVEPMLIANTLENTIVSLRREGAEIAPDKLEAKLTELFEAYGKQLFVKAAIPDVLKLVAKGASVSAAVGEGKLQRISGKELEKIAKENGNDVARIMQKYRLNVEPADLAKLRKN
jgi:glutamyl-tRNA(Gln) amidotransferase subunit E